MKYPSPPLARPFHIHQPSPFPSRPPYSMELCTEPLVIWLYIEGKGGARLRKIECLLVRCPEERASALPFERVNEAQI